MLTGMLFVMPAGARAQNDAPAQTGAPKAAPSAPKEATHSEPISAERPGFTNGADIVARGRVQFETGYTYYYNRGQKQHTVGDGGQIRLPVAPRLEIRFGIPAYLVQKGDGARVHGFADSTVAFKYQFLQANEKNRLIPTSAFIGTLEIPNGARDFRADDYQPTAAIENDWTISETLSVTADVVYVSVRQSGLRYGEWQGGVTLTKTLSPRYGTFAEVYRIADFGNGDTRTTYFDGGLTYRVGANTIFDVNGGVGAFGTRDVWFLGTGIARRW